MEKVNFEQIFANVKIICTLQFRFGALIVFIWICCCYFHHYHCYCYSITWWMSYLVMLCYKLSCLIPLFWKLHIQIWKLQLRLRDEIYNYNYWQYQNGFTWVHYFHVLCVTMFVCLYWIATCGIGIYLVNTGLILHHVLMTWCWVYTLQHMTSV